MAQVTNPFEGLQVVKTTTPPRRKGKTISAKQAALIQKLVQEKDVLGIINPKHLQTPDAFTEFLNSLTGGWEGTGSKLIDALFQAPYKKRTNVDVEPETNLPPAGYYGVDGKRYKIDRPEGKWAGWLFFKSGSDYHEQQKLGSVRPGDAYRGKAEEIFRTIAQDPKAAAQEYAQITNNCYVCNRKLEDPTSVSLGIGPICRNGGGF